MFNYLLNNSKIKKTLKQVWAYSWVSIVAYTYLITLVYIVVEFFKAPKTLAYALILGSAYVLTYILSRLYVFKSEDGHKTRLRYVFHVLSFWFLNIVFFYILAGIGLYYLYAVIINIAIFSILRFLSLKFFVFSDTNESKTRSH